MCSVLCVLRAHLNPPHTPQPLASPRPNQLKDIVKDNLLFAQCAAYIKDKSLFSEEQLEGLTAIVGDEAISAAILKSSRASMGMDVSVPDMLNISIFTERMVSLKKWILTCAVCSVLTVPTPPHSSDLPCPLSQRAVRLSPRQNGSRSPQPRHARRRNCCCPPHQQGRLTDQPGKVPGLDSADFRRREGPIPRFKDQGKHT